MSVAWSRAERVEGETSRLLEERPRRSVELVHQLGATSAVLGPGRLFQGEGQRPGDGRERGQGAGQLVRPYAQARPVPLGQRVSDGHDVLGYAGPEHVAEAVERKSSLCPVLTARR